MASELNPQKEVLDNISVIPFRFKYLPLLHEMNKNENLFDSELEYKNLPKIGYIAMLGKTPIAAGFLRRVEPNYAQFDTFLSNPYMGSKVRHLAIVKIVDSLFEDAKSLKLVGILAFTKDLSLLQRAKDQGFHIVDQVILAKALK